MGKPDKPKQWVSPKKTSLIIMPSFIFVKLIGIFSEKLLDPCLSE